LAGGGSLRAGRRSTAGHDHRDAGPAVAGARAAPKRKPRPKRATAPPVGQAPAPEPPAARTEEAPTIDPTPKHAAGPNVGRGRRAGSATTSTELPPKTLPPRIDLVYKAFLGTQGFMIGEATYRFEHAANEYRIVTVGEEKGLAALFLRGQGTVESRGTITAAGLQPQEFSVERGSRERRETALFDWETGIVTLHEEKTAVLELPTFDPLALMWQVYFSPPADPVQTISVATTRRVGRYTITREAEEMSPWGEGEIATERWHRRSEDGKTDGWCTAPTMHYVPVKMRVTRTYRGTLEALLDSIRVDEKLAQQ
jgi:hypothetical protein